MPYTSRCSSTASSSLSPEPQTPAPPIVVKPRRPSATRRPSLPKAARPAAAQVLGPPPPSPPLTAGASGSNDGSRSPPVRNSPPRARKPTKRKEAPVASSTTGVETVKRGKTTHACEACRRAKDKCDGTPPADGVGLAQVACKRCVKRGDVCDFPPLVKRGMSKSNPLRAQREQMDARSNESGGTGMTTGSSLEGSSRTTSPSHSVKVAA